MGTESLRTERVAETESARVARRKDWTQRDIAEELNCGGYGTYNPGHPNDILLWNGEIRGRITNSEKRGFYVSVSFAPWNTIIQLIEGVELINYCNSREIPVYSGGFLSRDQMEKVKSTMEELINNTR